MILANRSAIFDKRRALPTRRARALNARPPMRPIFKTAAAINGPILFFFPRPTKDGTNYAIVTFGELVKQKTKKLLCRYIIILSIEKAIKFGDKQMNEQMNKVKVKAICLCIR